MKKTLLMTAVLAGAALTSYAIPNPIPSASALPEFTQFDTEISVPSYANREIYKYVPSAPGTLYVYSKSTGSDPDLFVSTNYDASDYTLQAEQWSLGVAVDPISGYDYGYSYPVSPDKTMYISIPLTSWTEATSVYFTFDAAEVTAKAITEIFPAPDMDAVYNYNNYQEVQFHGNGSVTNVNTVVFSYLDQTKTLTGDYLKWSTYNPVFFSVFVAQFDLGNLVMEAANAGADEFTLTLTGVNVDGVPVTLNETGYDEVVVDNGTVSVTYPVGKAAAYLPEESTWPATFYNYWEQNDPAGMITLAFDMDITSVYQVNMIMDAVTPGGMTGGDDAPESYALPYKINGNKLIIDLTGVERYANVRTVTVIISSVEGANGLSAYMGEQGVALYQQVPFQNTPAPVSGIEEILVDVEGDAVVYNLQGVKVDPKNLTPGIYIVNGKKVAVK